jgi:hypothetical protein
MHQAPIPGQNWLWDALVYSCQTPAGTLQPPDGENLTLDMVIDALDAAARADVLETYQTPSSPTSSIETSFFWETSSSECTRTTRATSPESVQGDLYGDLVNYSHDILLISSQLYKVIERQFQLTNPLRTRNHKARNEYLIMITTNIRTHTANLLELSENGRAMTDTKRKSPEDLLKLANTRFKLVLKHASNVFVRRNLVGRRRVRSKDRDIGDEYAMEVQNLCTALYEYLKQVVASRPELNKYISEAMSHGARLPHEDDNDGEVD